MAPVTDMFSTFHSGGVATSWSAQQQGIVDRFRINDIYCHDDMINIDNYNIDYSGDSDCGPAVPWPIPVRSIMEERWRFRRNILEETGDHRRIRHVDPPMGHARQRRWNRSAVSGVPAFVPDALAPTAATNLLVNARVGHDHDNEGPSTPIHRNTQSTRPSSHSKQQQKHHFSLKTYPIVADADTNTTRNIAWVLYDRECRGGGLSATTLHPRQSMLGRLYASQQQSRRTRRQLHHRGPGALDLAAAGARSPTSTVVFDSPTSMSRGARRTTEASVNATAASIDTSNISNLQGNEMSLFNNDDDDEVELLVVNEPDDDHNDNAIDMVTNDGNDDVDRSARDVSSSTAPGVATRGRTRRSASTVPDQTGAENFTSARAIELTLSENGNHHDRTDSAVGSTTTTETTGAAMAQVSVEGQAPMALLEPLQLPLPLPPATPPPPLQEVEDDENGEEIEVDPSLFDNDATELDDDDSSKNRNDGASLCRVTYPLRICREVQSFAEHVCAVRYHSAFLHHLGGNDGLDEHGRRRTSSVAVSTISIAFSPDAQTMASTHGDHTVKISCCNTGRLLQTLDGHPRTPWTVKYHPTDAAVLASGCLGHQVRVWDWTTKQCLQMVRLDYAIISLSFHPSGTLLAVANGTRLHFWGVNDRTPTASANAAVESTRSHSSNSGDASNTTQQSQQNRSGLVTEIDQRHMLRCVHFPPDGRTIIVGGVNAQPPSYEHDPRRRGRSAAPGMSFYLRLWDFDPVAALQPSHQASLDHVTMPIPMVRRGISHPRIFVPRALLYNDGGFDVSPDGKTLCACAEYWLPDGVDNAMELLHQEEWSYELELRDEEQKPSLPASERISPSAPVMGSTLPASLTNVTAATAASIAETHAALSAALASRLTAEATHRTMYQGRSPSFREGMEQRTSNSGTNLNTGSTRVTSTGSGSRTPTATSGDSLRPAPPAMDYIPRTPPIPRDQPLRLSPPSPPGRRYETGMAARTTLSSAESAARARASFSNYDVGSNNPMTAATVPVVLDLPPSRMSSTPPPPPPPPRPPGVTLTITAHATSGAMALRPPHQLSVVSSISNYPEAASRHGRYVPHVVMISLDTTPLPKELEERLPRGKPYGAVPQGHRPRLGQLMEACPLDPAKASAVTCVKFSPSTDYCLIGYGVREPMVEGSAAGGTSSHLHPVTALYRIRGGMTRVSTMLSGDDDVNIARFHPDSGHGFVYGTKQGRVRVLSPRPWNFYYDESSP